MNATLTKLRGDLSEAEAAKLVGRSEKWWAERECGLKPLSDDDRAVLAKKFWIEWTTGGHWRWMND